MHNSRSEFIEKLIADCYRKDITEPDKVVKHISGSYVVQESCIKKYADLSKTTTSKEDE